MKKHILSFLMLFATISIAVAQPATMTKGQVSDSTQVDTLCQNRLSVEIVSVSGNNLDHPTHPATGIACPFFDAFTTSQTYSWYSWESSFFEHENSNTVVADVYYSGYIKVTVGDGYGHTGTDSIWFNVRNHEVEPLGDFLMEIDDDLHANFYGVATENHQRIRLKRSSDNMNYNTIYDLFLSNSEWYFRDTTTRYYEDSLWIYRIYVYDICGSYTVCNVPGVILSTTLHDYGQWYINIKSSIPTSEFVYFIYSIDENGHRHHFVDENGNPVTLPYWTTSWQIPGPHIDPYYQCGVGRQLEDGSYVLLSLSNKVPNPWPDIDGLDEQENKKSFSIFPNPANGMFTVEGKGQMRVCNLFGQIILTKEIDGQMTLELSPGMYFVNIDGATRKVVVE